jgi:membrane protease YdiL (CAAX protease family)
MIFLLVLMATLIGLSSVFEPATARLRAAAPVGTINSNYALLSEVFVSIAVFISLLIMRRIDKTPLAERNLGKRPRYGEVALGLSAGLSTLAFILLIQLALGVLRITPSAEAAPLQIHDCVIWAQCFLITGICEEAVFRGYLLGTLQKGLGFWPATAISSVLFALVHLPNYGERASGIFVCVLFSVLFALTVRLTGTRPGIGPRPICLEPPTAVSAAMDIFSTRFQAGLIGSTAGPRDQKAVSSPCSLSRA